MVALLGLMALPLEAREEALELKARSMEGAAGFDVSRLVDLSEDIRLSCLAAQVHPLLTPALSTGMPPLRSCTQHR